MKAILFTSLVIVLFAFAACSSGQEPPPSPSKYDSFAKCLKDSGVKVYSSFMCPVCTQQSEAFGSSFHYIRNIECHPNGENSQTQLCLKKNIELTPTWTLEENGVELKRLEGLQSLETLSELSGCPLEET